MQFSDSCKCIFISNLSGKNTELAFLTKHLTNNSESYIGLLFLNDVYNLIFVPIDS